ncbi:hypothetical protein TDB9533_04767 [Thalassocella blandensis]|nr:hypothetical protein TDB9533_04767 [Thalassocella blandensis]
MSPEKMWEEYQATTNIESNYTSWYFCDNEHDANELVELVVKGKKRATASVFELYEKENEKVPTVGKHSVITDWYGQARCVIKTTHVNLVSFNEVSETYASKEGEGDLSLEYWKKVHWECFGRDMESHNLIPRESMLIVCEEFEVVFK